MGERERLIARLSVFDDARAIAEVSKDKPRVVLHFGQIVLKMGAISFLESFPSDTPSKK
jgi:hypothetical protein